MAEAVVGAVVKKLGELIVQEAINLYGVSDQVKWLERELRRMQCFLKDADAKKNKGDDERVKHWVTEMIDLAFEVEDTIDSYMDFKLRRQERDGCIGFIERLVFIFLDLIHKHKVYVDVEGIKTKLQELSQSRSLYGIANIGETIGTTSHYRSQNVIPILPELSDDIVMVGFDDEKKKIVQELVDINNTNRSVISIVGMGGLGKTTLAKAVYNDHKVKRSFDMFAWVIISQEYTILEIVKKNLLAVSGTSSGETMDILAPDLYERLKKGKYLVVLDDVWEDNVWNELHKVCPDVNNGSRVIITTRSSTVINMANPTIQLHELHCLNETESWELFLRKVFPGQDIKTCCPTYLVDDAHQLVERCGGLPLALVVLGGFVSNKPQTHDAWQKVVESMKGQFVEGGERCLEILALSYNDLPYYLKSYFLYFGCFREDMNIPAETLIRLWSAEGFLPTKNGKTTEEIGLKCLEELAQRCLIQVTDRKYDGSAKYCRIHDLLRDMCIKEAKENKYLELYKHDTVDHVTMSNAARRLIIFNEIHVLNYCNSKLRGLFYHEDNYSSLTFKALDGQISGFKLLRVLCLKNIKGVAEFPSEIKSLIHLRYLELHAGSLNKVPSWIGHLRNLQTFIIHSVNLGKVSDLLWRIDSLMHVDLKSRIDVPHPSPNMGNNIILKNLQTLEGVTAGEWIGNMLPNLTNLRKLNIRSVSVDYANALSSSLQKLVRLTSLSIEVDLFIEGAEIPSDIVIKAFSDQHSCLKKLCLFGKLNCKQLPSSAVFLQQLVKLRLMHSELEQDPMATLQNLQFLKYLHLLSWSYVGKQMICSAKGFPQLLSLTIEGFYQLGEWQIEDEAMPRLKYLKLWSCPELKMIPEGLKTVPLDQLELFEMPKEFMTRIKENTGEDWCKIKHVPNVTIKQYY